MIPYEERRAVYEAAIDHYGVEHQIWKAVEEMSELIKELAKRQDEGGTTHEALVDELADATVMLEQLRLLFGVNKEVRDRMDFKVCRLARRLGMYFDPGAPDTGVM